MNRTLVWAALAFVPLACGTEEPQEERADPQVNTSLEAFRLESDPGEAVAVEEAKKAAPQDQVAVVGRIDKFVRGFATFTLVDEKLEYCGQVSPDSCLTPWDYCCIPKQEKVVSTMTVEVVDDEGAVLRTDAIPDLRLLDLVVVTGKLVKDEHGNVRVLANGWFKRERPELPDGLRWPG